MATLKLGLLIIFGLMTTAPVFAEEPIQGGADVSDFYKEYKEQLTALGVPPISKEAIQTVTQLLTEILENFKAQIVKDGSTEVDTDKLDLVIKKMTALIQNGMDQNSSDEFRRQMAALPGNLKNKIEESNETKEQFYREYQEEIKRQRGN